MRACGFVKWRGNKCSVERGQFFWGQVFFFIRGLKAEERKEAARRKNKEYLFPSFSPRARFSLSLSLAAEGVGHVDLADGGLGGQDGDLKEGRWLKVKEKKKEKRGKR